MMGPRDDETPIPQRWVCPWCGVAQRTARSLEHHAFWVHRTAYEHYLSRLFREFLLSNPPDGAQLRCSEIPEALMRCPGGEGSGHHLGYSLISARARGNDS